MYRILLVGESGDTLNHFQVTMQNCLHDKVYEENTDRKLTIHVLRLQKHDNNTKMLCIFCVTWGFESPPPPCGSTQPHSLGYLESYLVNYKEKDCWHKINFLLNHVLFSALLWLF